MKNINTYKLSKSFFDFVFETYQAKPYDIALFFYIVDLDNRLGWKEYLDLPTKLTMSGSRIGSYKRYKKSLENLADWGFIDWVYRASNDSDAANIVKLNCIVENKEADSKAINKAVMMHYRSNDDAGVLTINNKIYKPFTLKPFNYIENIIEENDFLKYKKLKVENQKLIIENLKTILKRNFDLLSINDLSQVEFGIKFRREIDVNLKDLEVKVTNDIHNYFGLKELNNLRLLKKVDEFVTYLSQSNQIDFYNENFSYYQQYKDMTGQTQHGIEKFIGKKEMNYQDGAWQLENFKNKVKHFEKNQFFSARQKGKKADENDLEEGKNNVLRRLANG